MSAHGQTAGQTDEQFVLNSKGERGHVSTGGSGLSKLCIPVHIMEESSLVVLRILQWSGCFSALKAFNMSLILSGL